MTKTTLWAGRILSGIPVLFLLMDGVMKFIQPAPVLEATTQLGIDVSLIVTLGGTLLACTALYLIPRTSILGAILLTGYLGGAIQSHLRVGNPLFSHILFPVYLGVMLWAGLYLRNESLRKALQ